MESKVFWVSRDKDTTGDVLFWMKKPELDEEGDWRGKGKNTEPDLILDLKEVARVFGVKVKTGEIRVCRIEIVDEA